MEEHRHKLADKISEIDKAQGAADAHIQEAVDAHIAHVASVQPFVHGMAIGSIIAAAHTAATAPLATAATTATAATAAVTSPVTMACAAVFAGSVAIAAVNATGFLHVQDPETRVEGVEDLHKKVLENITNYEQANRELLMCQHQYQLHLQLHPVLRPCDAGAERLREAEEQAEREAEEYAKRNE